MNATPPFPFSDLALARRLERAEAMGGVRLVEARARIAPEVGAVWMETAGAHAIFDGPESPVTQTFGLGLFAAPAEADLDRLETFFEEREAPISHEVSPLAGVQLAARLVKRGYEPVEFTSVMLQAMAPAAVEALPTRVTTRRMEKGEEELWSQVSARGWAAEHPELDDFIRALGAVLAVSEGTHCFFAELDGEPVATGVLRCDGGVALFGGAATVPEARRQGAQRALLETRRAFAAAQGCDLVMVCAQPGSASQRNAERQGFRIAYTRTKWRCRGWSGKRLAADGRG